MSRATIGLTFFAGMVIGLIMISMLLGFCSKAWAWLNRGMEGSVDKLADALEDVKADPGSLANTFLTLEKNSVVLIFKPNVPTLHAKDARGWTHAIKRPQECQADQFCVCSCHLKSDVGGSRCELTHCRNIQNVEFYDNFRDCEDDQRWCFEYVEGGAAFYDDFEASFYVLGSGGRVEGTPKREKQLVTVENYEGLVAICDRRPCVTDADKTLIRQLRELQRFKQTAERCATFTGERCGCATLDVVPDPQGAAKIEIDRESQDPPKTRVRLRDEDRDRAVMDYELPFYLCTNEVRWEFPSPNYYVNGLDITWQSIQADEDADDLGFDGYLPGTRRLGLMRAGDQRCFMDNGDSHGDDLLLSDSGQVLRREDNAVVIPAC